MYMFRRCKGIEIMLIFICYIEEYQEANYNQNRSIKWKQKR